MYDDNREANSVGADLAKSLTEYEENQRRLFAANRMKWWMICLIVLLIIAALPTIGERWAYSTQRGIERAKREEAVNFLKEHPDASEKSRIPFVVKLVGPSVVGIKTNTIQQTFFGNATIAAGQGSGVIVDPSGLIVTNFHVICENGRLVDGVEIVLSDGRAVSDGVALVGFDEKLDLAVLKINASDLTAIEWGDSDALEVGDPVLALGNPYGLAKTVTEGIVSAKERFVFDEQGVVAQEFLQTDAAVNPGNSGGALVNDRGQLVGINTAIYGSQYQGISFALPSALVKRTFDDILSRAVR